MVTKREQLISEAREILVTHQALTSAENLRVLFRDKFRARKLSVLPDETLEQIIRDKTYYTTPRRPLANPVVPPVHYDLVFSMGRETGEKAMRDRLRKRLKELADIVARRSDATVPT